jgi:hypothetical protein
VASVTFNFKQDANTVYAFVSDAEAVRKRSEAFGDRDIRIDVKEAGGAKTVTNTRLVTADVPGFMKKLFNPTNTVVDAKAWRADGDKWVGKLDVDVQGTPTELHGTITIAPAGGGCTYTVDFKGTAKVPLIGKKIEAYVEEQSAKGMREEYEYNQKQLDAAG